MSEISAGHATTKDTKQVHSASAAGFSHQANALYDQGRPAYSHETLDWILDQTVLQPISNSQSSTNARIYRLLDLGAGTGIFTRCLADRLAVFQEKHGQLLKEKNVTFEILALEPVEGMRQRFRECCPATLTIADGSGSSMPTIADHSIDVIIAAQAFHWFATKDALAEFKRVLNPATGFFVPVWNSRDTSVPWIREMEDIVDSFYGPDVPRQQTKAWKKVFEPKETSPFTLVASKDWSNTMEQRGTDAIVLARILSISVIAALSPAEQETKVIQPIRAILAKLPGAKTNEFVIPYTTDAYIYQVRHD